MPPSIEDAAALPSQAVLQQAATWYACLRDGRAGTTDHAGWQDWVHADPAHRAAWRHVQDIAGQFEDTLGGRPEARQAADALGVATGRLRSRRRALSGLAAAGGVTLAGWLGWRESLLPDGAMAWSADYRTGTGEQREIVLADGSRVWLNTRSAIDVLFDARERVVVLVEGEIFIATAHDAARPFLVRTGHGRLQALGTRYNVRREAGRTLLAVYEGAVEIRAEGGSVRRLAAGRQARFDQNVISAAEPADDARSAWTDGVLVAENITLRQLLQELQRYRHGHLGVADEVADLRVYGNFPAHDPDRVLRMLASALPVRIEQPLPWWTSVEARR
ncbi:DUF4880 domain-containing protein [Xylophilus sp. Kf1]|nr:DUF4880 domain-containing protein [Xylophilus sp. Kf1]